MCLQQALLLQNDVNGTIESESNKPQAKRVIMKIIVIPYKCNFLEVILYAYNFFTYHMNKLYVLLKVH